MIWSVFTIDPVVAESVGHRKWRPTFIFREESWRIRRCLCVYPAVNFQGVMGFR